MHASLLPWTPALPLALAAAAAFLLLPLALLAHWTATAERGGERAWFRFVVRVQLFVLAAAFVDAPAVRGLGLERAIAPNGGPGTLIYGWPVWAPAVLVALVHLTALAFAARRVRRRLRGVTGATTNVRVGIHSLLAKVSPMLG